MTKGNDKMSRQLKGIAEYDAILFYIGALLQEMSSKEVTAFDFVTVMKALPDCDLNTLPMYTKVALDIESEMWKAFKDFETMVEH